jgi:glycosyltransferase involved in cell wall biosynthesis
MRDDVCELLKMADISLLTSEDESCPFAVLEAMASGLPVITTSSGGARELVLDQETGFLVKGCDRYNLVRRMAQLAEDPMLRQRLGMAARVRAASNFTLETMVRKTHALDRAAWDQAFAGVPSPCEQPSLHE